MILISLPNKYNFIDHLNKAFRYKSGKYKYHITLNELQTILDLYKKYDLLLGQPDDDFKSINLSKQTNDALHNAYNEIQIGGRLSKLREEILLLVERCTYCGILPADELDHYLPKSTYKATSIYLKNLIPICHTCNNKKRTAVNIGGNTSFYHAYFEKFPDEPFFISEIDFSDGTLWANFKLNKDNISDDLCEKLNFQINRTDLETRLNKEINTFLFDIKESINDIFDTNGKNGVVERLLKQSLNYKNSYGVNYWKTVFLIGLSNCNSFCNGGFVRYYNK